MLPEDASLGANQWSNYSGNDFSACSTDGNVLHIVDASTTAAACFYRHAAPASSPITVEARVRVASGEGSSLSVGTPSFLTSVQLTPSQLSTYFDSAGQTYSEDMTVFHTIRIAINAQGQSYIWNDGTLVAQGLTSSGSQGGVMFGSVSAINLNDSYWDYAEHTVTLSCQFPSHPLCFRLREEWPGSEASR